MSTQVISDTTLATMRARIYELVAERDALRLEVERNGEAIKLVADQADAWRLERDALRAALTECAVGLATVANNLRLNPEGVKAAAIDYLEKAQRALAKG